MSHVLGALLGLAIVLATVVIPVAAAHSSPEPSTAVPTQDTAASPAVSPAPSTVLWPAQGGGRPPTDGPLPQFLTLPFRSTAGMVLEQGWLWVGCCHELLHGGVDYIHGLLDQSSTWDSFPVIAAASGRVCAGLDGQPSCGFTGVGNRVVMRHRLNGDWWYTYYGHLKTINPSIPFDRWSDVKVARGTFLGSAGYSGDPCCVTHLHFSVFDSSYVSRDPYGLYARRRKYPDPAGTNGLRNGTDALWRRDPPRVPASGSRGSVRVGAVDRDQVPAAGAHPRVLARRPRR